MSKFWNEYKEMQKGLLSVGDIINENIKTGEKFLNDSLKELFNGGGKMLRPAFLILASGFGELEKEKMYNMAAAIEILHMGTLIHDDIIDNAKLRRNVESVQSKYGKDFAVYAGDFLYTQCFTMLFNYDYNQENLKRIPRVISNVCLGEMRQYSLRYSFNTDVKTYLKIISAKTAALFALSFSAGAIEAGCDKTLAKRLTKIGYYMGMAFQILDDILDFTGTTEALGKSAQKDLMTGYYTLPIIYAVKHDQKQQITNLIHETDFCEEDLRRITNLVVKNKGVEEAKQLAKKFTEKTYKEITLLPEHKNKEIIRQIAEKLLERKY